MLARASLAGPLCSPPMSGDSERVADGLVPFPTPANVARSLQWLRRELPLAPSRVLDCYDLLCLPCLDDDAVDLVERANRLPMLLGEAAKRVPDVLHRLVLEEVLLSGEAGSTVTTRLRTARARAAAQGLVGERTSEKTLGDIEYQALARLATILLSKGFAAAVLPRASARHSSEVSERGLGGYVVQAWAVKLSLSPEEPMLQRYRRSMRIRSTSPRTRVVSHSYHWSGGGTSPIPQVLSTEHYHSWLGTRPEPPEFASDWYVAFFHLGGALQDGETVDLEWSEEFKDTDGTFRDFLTCPAAFSDMEYLRFEVEGLAPGFRHQVDGGVFEMAAGRLVPNGPTEPIVPGVDGVYKYEVKAPKKGTTYGLRWSGL